LKPRHLDIYYYRTQHGAECDVILVDGLKPVAAVEIKYAKVSSLSNGFYYVLDDLQISKAFVMTPDEKRYVLDDKTKICGLQFFLINILNGL